MALQIENTTSDEFIQETINDGDNLGGEEWISPKF